RTCPSCGGGWGGTSRTTTRSARTRPWVTGRRRPCIGRGGAGGGRRGGRGGVFFPPPPPRPRGGGAGGGRKPPKRGDRGRPRERGKRSSPLCEVRNDNFLV